MQFVSEENAIRQAGITRVELQELGEAGVICAVKKGSCTFYSKREIYRVKAIKFLMKTRGLTLEEARLQVDGVNENRGKTEKHNNP